MAAQRKIGIPVWDAQEVGADTQVPAERQFLEAKRELVAESRRVVQAAPVAEELGGQGEISIVGRGTEKAKLVPAVSKSKSQIQILRQLVKRALRPLVPKLLREQRYRRVSFRRFVISHTASSFTESKPDLLLTAHLPEALLGSNVPAAFLALGPISAPTADAIEDFLAENPEDDDDQLVRRLDGRGDEVGAVLSDLRVRLDLCRLRRPDEVPTGSQILFDARSLQAPAFRLRGIGVFAMALLDAVRAAFANDEIVLLVDPLATALPDEIRGGLAQASFVHGRRLETFGLFVQPSPMTHDVAPLVPIFRSGVPSVAVVYDFIPAEHPTVYLPSPSSRLRYGTQLQALALYGKFLPISSSVEKSLHSWVRGSIGKSTVTWPAHLSQPRPLANHRHTGHGERIVIFGANEPRKNTLAALAGVEKATRGRKVMPRVIIFGMADHEDVARHWVGLAGLSNTDVTVAHHLSKDDRDDVVANASLVLVPSFAEGLSLPVIEALNSRTPVVASRIDVHEELLGDGSHLAHPARPGEWAKAIRIGLTRPAWVLEKQLKHFAGVRKESFESLLPQIVDNLQKSRSANAESPVEKNKQAKIFGALPSIGIATPWPMQKSGVADYSWETLAALSQISNITVYATSSVRKGSRWNVRSLHEAYDAQQGHDGFVSVLGNSHFHIPVLSLLRHSGGVALAHDSKMVELYAAVGGQAATQNLMRYGSISNAVTQSLDDQIRGNTYSNLGFGEIAEAASTVIFHSPGAAARVCEETGKTMQVLPFVPQRRPAGTEPLDIRRRVARQDLGFEEPAIHILSLGIIDPRTKLHDLILEACLWLRMWGYDIHLHFVGSDGGAPGIVRQMKEQSREAGHHWFHSTGFTTEARMRQYLTAADIMVQLRSGSVPMLSGPVADAAAFGTPVLASELLLEDTELPGFVQSVGSAVSPLTLAERLAAMITDRWSSKQLDEERLRYLSVRNSDEYAKALLELLQELA
jgi:glycosyltransferase involved in cell wall biosynthesis